MGKHEEWILTKLIFAATCINMIKFHDFVSMSIFAVFYLSSSTSICNNNMHNVKQTNIFSFLQQLISLIMKIANTHKFTVHYVLVYVLIIFWMRRFKEHSINLFIFKRNIFDFIPREVDFGCQSIIPLIYIETKGIYP